MILHRVCASRAATPCGPRARPFAVRLEKFKKRGWVMAHPDKVLVDVEGSSLGALELEHGEPERDRADDRDNRELHADRHDPMART